MEGNESAQRVELKLKELMKEKNKLKDIRANLLQEKAMLESNLKAIYREADMIKAAIHKQMVGGDTL